MEENVALDSSKQKKFAKSIKGIKKLLKGKDKSQPPKEEKKDQVKACKVKKPKRKPRGLVYLSHIPHGFYEHQMTEYFKQFGVVTNARVIRSKRTGMSKGHAFVEFKDPNVAEIVAETMNNYLMGKRLIKAALIPSEKQKRNARRKNWNPQNNPGSNLRQKMKKKHNDAKSETEELKIAKRLLSNLTRTKGKLRELDIDYDFFLPVDVPEELLNLVEIKKEEEVPTTEDIKEDEKPQNKTQEEKTTQNKKKKNKKKTTNAEVNVEQKPQKAEVPMTSKKVAKKAKEDDKSNKTLKNKDIKNVVKDNKASKLQEQKEKKLKAAGVKAPEFIKIQEESGDESDGSMEFDSDEYEKMIEMGDSDLGSDSDSDESDQDLDEEVTSEEESVIDVPPPKKVKAPPTQKSQPDQSKKPKNKPNTNKKLPQVIQPIKKTPQKETKPSKKPKFEKKGSQKTLNKVIKKKK